MRVTSTSLRTLWANPKQDAAAAAEIVFQTQIMHGEIGSSPTSRLLLLKHHPVAR